MRRLTPTRSPLTRPPPARSALTLGIALSIVSFALAAACNATAGVPIELALVLEGSGAAAATTPSGWQVTLTEARIALGPLYAFAPSDEMARAGESLRRALVPVARAHGGFEPFEGREVRTQVLDQVVLDVLGEPIVRSGVEGLEGDVEAITVLLEPPAPEHASVLHGHHAWVAGTAIRNSAGGAESVRFEGGLDLSDEGLTRRVDGIAVGAPIAEGSTLTITADASAWLREADFTGLTPDPDGVVRFGAATQPYRAWLLGARSAGSYSARVTPGE
ncbi:MAG: hypothetical protein IT378_16170 [Sandaracinaceae bacterium]|nr:hypothetical protein [Sandaracinaceae bacterium]